MIDLKLKQWIGILAAVCIIVVGALGTSIKYNRSNERETTGLFEKMNLPPMQPYISRIEISGEMSRTDTGSIFTESSGYQHQKILAHIDDIITDSNNKAILLAIDSPGGEAYAADELYLKLMEYKERTGRPIYTSIGSMAASGGYYAASASDKIYANRSSWVGSIGCYIQMTDTTGLEKKIGVKRFLIKSGKNKGMGASFQKLTHEQKNIFQGLIDDGYSTFVDVVCNARNYSVSKCKRIADGRIYTAAQSIDNHLIDGLNSEQDVIDLLLEKTKLSSAKIYDPLENNNSIWSSFVNGLSNIQPGSDAKVIKDFVNEEKSGVLMYRAEGIR